VDERRINKMRKISEIEEEKVTRGSFPMNLQFFATDSTEDKEDEDNADEGDEDDTDGESEGDINDQTKKSGRTAGKAGKTFTQEQVTKMMTREKNQGRNAALKELGIDPKDTKTVKMIQAFIASQKSGDEDSNDNSEAQQKLQEATDRALKAECKAEAMALGAKKEFVDDVVVLVMAKYNEDADFKTLIGEVKTKYKTFFEGDSEEEKQTGKKGTGSALKKDKSKDNDEKSMGSRLAAQRVGTAKKTSNFIKRN
jgi:hypothetical protein